MVPSASYVCEAGPLAAGLHLQRQMEHLSFTTLIQLSQTLPSSSLHHQRSSITAADHWPLPQDPRLRGLWHLPLFAKIEADALLSPLQLAASHSLVPRSPHLVAPETRWFDVAVLNALAFADIRTVQMQYAAREGSSDHVHFVPWNQLFMTRLHVYLYTLSHLFDDCLSHPNHAHASERVPSNAHSSNTSSSSCASSVSHEGEDRCTPPHECFARAILGSLHGLAPSTLALFTQTQLMALTSRCRPFALRLGHHHQSLTTTTSSAAAIRTEPSCFANGGAWTTVGSPGEEEVENGGFWSPLSTSVSASAPTSPLYEAPPRMNRRGAVTFGGTATGPDASTVTTAMASLEQRRPSTAHGYPPVPAFGMTQSGSSGDYRHHQQQQLQQHVASGNGQQQHEMQIIDWPEYAHAFGQRHAQLPSHDHTHAHAHHAPSQGQDLAAMFDALGSHPHAQPNGLASSGVGSHSTSLGSDPSFPIGGAVGGLAHSHSYPGATNPLTNGLGLGLQPASDSAAPTQHHEQPQSINSIGSGGRTDGKAKMAHIRKRTQRTAICALLEHMTRALDRAVPGQARLICACHHQQQHQQPVLLNQGITQPLEPPLWVIRRILSQKISVGSSAGTLAGMNGVGKSAKGDRAQQKRAYKDRMRQKELYQAAQLINICNWLVRPIPACRCPSPSPPPLSILPGGSAGSSAVTNNQRGMHALAACLETHRELAQASLDLLSRLSKRKSSLGASLDAAYEVLGSVSGPKADDRHGQETCSYST